MMRTFNATVRGGRITLDEPTDLPDGTLELMLTEDAFTPALSEEEQASLNRELERAMAEEDEGRLVDAKQAIAELRGPR
jgi:hypothetical protein